MCHRVDASPAAMVRFNGIIRLVSISFQHLAFFSLVLVVAEHRGNDGEKICCPCTLKHSSRVAGPTFLPVTPCEGLTSGF